MIRKILITIAAAAISQTLSAQSLEAFKDRLSSPVVTENAYGGARVTVSERGDAARAVADASRVGARNKIRGYRVCIFFDNSPDARSNAVAARSLFESTFPGIRIYWAYDTPYYRVSVGNCLTNEEAIMLKGRISEAFPKAYIKNEEFAIGELLN